MSREYTSSPKHLRVIHRPVRDETRSVNQEDSPHPSVAKYSNSVQPASSYKAVTKFKTPWYPINNEEDSSYNEDDNLDDYVQEQAVPEVEHLPLTPPLSHPAANIPELIIDQPSSPEVSPQDMELILTESDVSLDPVSPSATELSTDLDCVPDMDPRSLDVYAVPEDVTDAGNLEVLHYIQEMAEMADKLAVNSFLDARP